MIVRYGRDSDYRTRCSLGLVICFTVATWLTCLPAHAAIMTQTPLTPATGTLTDTLVESPKTNTETAFLVLPVQETRSDIPGFGFKPDKLADPVTLPANVSAPVKKWTPKVTLPGQPLKTEEEDSPWLSPVSSGPSDAEPTPAARTAGDPDTEGSSSVTVAAKKPIDNLPDAYLLSSTSAGTVQVEAKSASEGDSASLLINQQEVLRFRSSYKQLTSHQRAKQAAHRLQAFLKNQGTYQNVGVHTSAGVTEIRLGTAPFVVVDPRTAKLAGMSSHQLAKVWTTQVRRSLGQSEAPTIAHLLPATLTPSVKAAGKLIAAGMASYYGPGFHGRRAADGSRFNQNAMTAAHKTLPFGTLVRVTNHRTGLACIVRITDRGPFIAGRVIDLSVGAARAIGMLGSGVARVSLEVLR